MTTNSEKYDIFVCYETYTGAGYAEHLADCLETRFGTRVFAAVRPDNIPAGYHDEQQFRYDAIRNSEYLLLIATNAILDSQEVKNELQEALDSNKKIIICTASRLDLQRFRKDLPALASVQRMCEFSEKTELANSVVDWYVHTCLRKKAEDIEASGEEEYQPDNQLVVSPAWSVEHVSEKRAHGRIIFDILNQTGDTVLLHGYRMFRQAPGGMKDFFYKGARMRADEYTGWASSEYFRMLLLDKDRHVFNWAEVNIPETYGIDHRGLWVTEVQVAYLRQGTNSLLVSIGKTELEFK